MANLKVAVRIRPMAEREVSIGALPALTIEDGKISVTNIKVPEHHAGDSRERVRKFYFDYCFDETSSQDEVFSMIENEISTALTSRYHACVLAYGQSSTGKTYTMMGTQEDPGLTPRLCDNIFNYFQSSITEEEVKVMRIYVSYLEIYNERVLDLLIPNNSGKSLKVREHPKKGPYVQGLTEHRVETSSDLLSWLNSGNGNRRVAATSNNRRSSRSHCVFTVSIWAAGHGRGSPSRLHLVDLAGSERANYAGGSVSNSHTVGPRLKEGANINRSLVALGNVICALSDQPGKSKKQPRKRFVPYRDSVLTWLLKETLGGNSKTVMIATISPSSTCFNETVNTLRFGQRAQQIVNQPLANEDSQEKLIRELRNEIARLKELINAQNLHASIRQPGPFLEKFIDMSENSPPIDTELIEPTPQNRSSDELTLTLLPVELITSENPPKIIEFIPENSKSTFKNTPSNHSKIEDEVLKESCETQNKISSDNDFLTNLKTGGIIPSTNESNNSLHNFEEPVKYVERTEDIKLLSPVTEYDSHTIANVESINPIASEENYNTAQKINSGSSKQSELISELKSSKPNNELDALKLIAELLIKKVPDASEEQIFNNLQQLNDSSQGQINTLAEIINLLSNTSLDTSGEQSEEDVDDYKDSISKEKYAISEILAKNQPESERIDEDSYNLKKVKTERKTNSSPSCSKETPNSLIELDSSSSLGEVSQEQLRKELNCTTKSAASENLITFKDSDEAHYNDVVHDNDLLKDFLTSLVQKISDIPSNEASCNEILVNSEENQYIQQEAFALVSKLLNNSSTSNVIPQREKTFIIKPKDNSETGLQTSSENYTEKDTWAIVNDFLKKAFCISKTETETDSIPNVEKLATTSFSHEKPIEIQKVKNDILILVNELLNKVDKIKKTLHDTSKEELEISTVLDDVKCSYIDDKEPPQIDDKSSKLYIEEIEEVSRETSPVCGIRNEIEKPETNEQNTLEENCIKSNVNSNTVSLELNNTDVLTENDTKALESSENSEIPAQNQIDTLIPVIDITSSIKPKQNKVNNFNRTNSVDVPPSNIKRLAKKFGSHETLSGVPPAARRPSLLTKNGKLSAVNRSFIKTTETLSNNPSRSGSISESSGVSTPKKGFGITKKVTHKRSEIVAAVTQRLYSRRRERQEEEKLAQIESNKMFNAKMRLQDITQRALRANKRRVHVETQTEDPCTVRMKEKSTDVQDIAKVSLKVKDVFVEAITNTQNIGISCQIQNSSQSLKLTGTCSTQTDEQTKQNQTVSFTKYLQNPPLRIHPYSQPIYTSSVNINVQHNYPHAKDDNSDDSLEENGYQTVQFSTPDLISNHNSLEQVNVPQKNQTCVTTQTEKKSILHADINKEKFLLNECFATKKCEYCVAETSFVVPSVKQTLTDISIPVVRAPETCCFDQFTEKCTPLRLQKCQKPELAKSTMTFEGCQQIKSAKTSVNQCDFQRNKSPVRPCMEQYSSEDDETDDECYSSHNKKVRFAQPKRKDMLEVVTNFLDEASNLLFKLNTVAKQVEVNKERHTRYIFPRMRYGRERKECYVQTASSLHDASAQTCLQDEETSSQTPDWNKVIGDCSTKHKVCSDVKENLKSDEKQNKNQEDSDSDYLNMQTTSTDWKFSPGEYSSLDTMRSTSDYGSLSRGQGITRKNHYSPKAYMQQLVAQRKKIVQDSRNDILANEYMRLPSPELF